MILLRLEAGTGAPSAGAGWAWAIAIRRNLPGSRALREWTDRVFGAAQGCEHAICAPNGQTLALLAEVFEGAADASGNPEGPGNYFFSPRQTR